MQLKDGHQERRGTIEGGQGFSTDGTRPPQVPVFFNPMGVSRIEIGVSAFDCIGLLPPDDHPHVSLNMGEQPEIRCPYCSTQYRRNSALRWNETVPPNCFVVSA